MGRYFTWLLHAYHSPTCERACKRYMMYLFCPQWYWHQNTKINHTHNQACLSAQHSAPGGDADHRFGTSLYFPVLDHHAAAQFRSARLRTCIEREESWQCNDSSAAQHQHFGGIGALRAHAYQHGRLLSCSRLHCDCPSEAGRLRAPGQNTILQGEIITCLPSPHFWAEGIFKGEGCGLYILKPPAAGFPYAPPLVCAPHP